MAITEPFRGVGQEVRGVSEELQGILSELRELASKEVELGLTETKEQAQTSLKGLMLAGIAFVIGEMGLFFAFLTMMFVLDTGMELWLAALLTTILALALAAIAGLMARNTFNKVNFAPKRFLRSVDEDYKWLRAQMRSNAR